MLKPKIKDDRKLIYLVLFILALIVTLMAIYNIVNDCHCHKYKTYNEFTLSPEGEISFNTDSVCIISSDRKGNITTKQIK